MSNTPTWDKAIIAVKALFPRLDDEAQEAIAWLITDLLTSLDAIYQNLPD